MNGAMVAQSKGIIMRVLLAAFVLASGLISPALAADKANSIGILLSAFDRDRGRDSRLRAVGIVERACQSIDGKTPRLSPDTQRWMQSETDAGRLVQISDSSEYAKQFITSWATECQHHTQTIRQPSSERQEMLAWTLLAAVMSKGDDAALHMKRLQRAVPYTKDELAFTLVSEIFAREIVMFVVADHLRKGL